MFEMEVFEEPGRHTLEEHGRHTPVRMDSRTCKARHCVIIVLYSLDLLPVTGGHGASVGNYVMFSSVSVDPWLSAWNFVVQYCLGACTSCDFISHLEHGRVGRFWRSISQLWVSIICGKFVIVGKFSALVTTVAFI